MVGFGCRREVLAPHPAHAVRAQSRPGRLWGRHDLALSPAGRGWGQALHLTRQTVYQDLGGYYFDERDCEAVKRRAVRRLEKLG